jgi:hypothetical protein
MLSFLTFMIELNNQRKQNERIPNEAIAATLNAKIRFECPLLHVTKLYKL